MFQNLANHWAYIISLNPYNILQYGMVIIPILQMKRLRFREKYNLFDF